jgi:hypothetical protein
MIILYGYPMAAVATTWTGALVRKPGGTYEMRLIALTTTDPTEPPEELPMIWAVKGDVRFDGCDTIIIEYNWFGIYEWDKVPFVVEPATWLIYSGQDPIVETIKRMLGDTELPDLPPPPAS